MVAQTSSAGGDRAPKRVRIKFEVTIDVTVETLPEEPATPEPVAEPAPETAEELSDSAIHWLTLADANGVGSDDGRFVIVAQGTGPVNFIVTDRWTGEIATVFDRLRAAVNWCRGRLAGVPLLWVEDRHGWKAERNGPVLRVTPEGEHYRARDCRFGTEHKSRFSPHFDSLETAQRWCEVRAVCLVEGEYATATLHYVGPAETQS